MWPLPRPTNDHPRGERPSGRVGEGNARIGPLRDQTDRSRQLRPVNWVEPSIFRTDRHQRISAGHCIASHPGQVRAISRTVSPLSRRSTASRIWCAVSFGLRPIFTPRALARSRPSPVRARISSRSNSARPPRIVSIKRPWAVVVSASVSPRDRNPASRLATAANVFKRSRVDRANQVKARHHQHIAFAKPTENRAQSRTIGSRAARGLPKDLLCSGAAQLLHLRVHARPGISDISCTGLGTAGLRANSRIARGRSNRRGLNRQAGRKRRCATVPPGGQCTKASRALLACSCTPLPSSEGTLQGVARVTVPPLLGRKA
jgi:hypothetical protein